MKMKELFLLVLSLMLGMSCFAQQQVTREEAVNVAVSVMKCNRTEISSHLIDTIYTYRENNHTLLFEVHFNTGESVLLSGSKACTPVLGLITNEFGVSTNGILNQYDQIPEGLSELIDSYIEQIRYSFDNNLKPYYYDEWRCLQSYSEQMNRSINEVTPLLSTRWGETISNDNIDSHAYNYYITIGNNSVCPSSYYCPVGHPAVAMGQILNYWNYPVEVPGYCYEFDWNNMPDELNTSSNDYFVERNAVAQLLKDLGESLQIAYCYLGECNSSATINDVWATFKKFGYPEVLIEYMEYHPDDWNEILQNELDNNRPVFYAASNNDRGKAFVCHGYRSMLWGSIIQYYISWGKNGDCDGWYNINNLNPSFSSSSYSFNHVAIINIEPNKNCWDNIKFRCNVLLNYNEIVDYHSHGIILNDNHQFKIGYGAKAIMEAKTIVLSNGFHAHPGSYCRATVNPCIPLTSEVEERYNNGNAVVDYSFDDTMKTPANTNHIVIYPNPTADKLNVRIDSVDERIVQLAVIDLFGNMELLKDGPNCDDIDVSSLPSGIHVLKVNTDVDNYYLRFIKK